MTHSRKTTEQRDTEQHRSKARGEHRVGQPQRPRPARRGAGEHREAARTRDRQSAGPSSARAVTAESAAPGNDRLADVAAVSLLVLGYAMMIVFFVGLAVDF